ncbi:MAG: protein disulfide oxidoreductase [Parashewanella sp.]
MKNKQSWSQKVKSKSFWMKLARDLLLMIILITGLSIYLQRNMASGKAPNIQGMLLTGKGVDLAIQASPEPTLVYFWGSWCGYCKVTSPMVNTLAKNHQVISIAVASGTNAQVANYLQANQLSFPTINDEDNSITQQWGVSGVPAIFIVNKDGNITAKTTGPTSKWGMQFRLWLAKY